MGKVCKLHPHTPQPSTLLSPGKNFAGDHLLVSSHLGQTWAASFQRIVVNHVAEALYLKVIWLSRRGGFGGLGGGLAFTPAMSLGGE